MDTDEMKPEKPKVLPEKHFQNRDSTLTDLLRDNHVNAVYSLVVTIFLLLFCRNTLNDYFYNGGSEYGFRIIKEAFGKFHLVIFCWCVMLALHCILYLGWNLWYMLSPAKGTIKEFWNVLWISAVYIKLGATFHCMSHFCLSYALPMGSIAVVLGEQTRLIMKGHSFIRENSKLISQGNFKMPKFSHYLYFSFVPTLIYRSEYPRRAARSWKVTFKFATECLISIYFLSLIEDKYFIKPYQNFGKKPFTRMDILMIILDNGLPSFLWITVGVMVIVHSSQNAVGELLRFGDRKFYEAWWTSTNIATYYVTWNTLVQDWLYAYVYKDFYEIVIPKNKFVAKLAVFLLSVVMHEVLLIYTIQIVCPVFLTSMMLSFFIMMNRSKDRRLNRLVILMCVFGNSVLLTFPHLEYFAKTNCPRPVDSLLYVPRLYSCY